MYNLREYRRSMKLTKTEDKLNNDSIKGSVFEEIFECLLKVYSIVWMTLSIQYSTMREQIEMFLRCNFRPSFENMSSDYILVVQFFQETMFEGTIYWFS